jgi:hypothetical protein
MELHRSHPIRPLCVRPRRDQSSPAGMAPVK